MAEITNIGTPSIVNPGIIPLAIEAGIETTIRSLIGLGKDRRTLLIELKEALWESNQALSVALDSAVLDGILNYLADTGRPVALRSQDLPKMVNQDGPAGTWVSYADGTLSVTWTTPPTGWTSDIYVDGVLVKHSDVTDDVDGNADDTVTGLSLSAGDHTVRVLYRRSEDGAMSRFGVVATVTV